MQCSEFPFFPFTSFSTSSSWVEYLKTQTYQTIIIITSYNCNHFPIILHTYIWPWSSSLFCLLCKKRCLEKKIHGEADHESWSSRICNKNCNPARLNWIETELFIKWRNRYIHFFVFIQTLHTWLIQCNTSMIHDCCVMCYVCIILLHTKSTNYRERDKLKWISFKYIHVMLFI